MTGGIYLVGESGLVEMVETRYEREDMLQSLLAEHPKLLACEQMDSAEPRRWLLIRREAPVPAGEGAGR